MYVWADLIDVLTERAMAWSIGVDIAALARAAQLAYTEIGSQDWRRYICWKSIGVSAAIEEVVSHDGKGKLTASRPWPDWVVLASVEFPDKTIGQVRSITGNTAIVEPYSSESFSNESVTVAQTALPVTDARAILEMEAFHQEVRIVSFSDLASQKVSPVAGVPEVASIGAGPRQGAVEFYPGAKSSSRVDVLYLRRAKPLPVTGYSVDDFTGKVSITQGSQVLSGSGTMFGKLHEGAVIRLSGTGQAPGGQLSANRYVWECRIKSVTSASQAVLEASAPVSLSSVGYRISAELDIDDHVWPALTSLAAAKLAETWNTKMLEACYALYRRSLSASRAAEGTLYGQSFAEPRQPRVRPVIGPTVE